MMLLGIDRTDGSRPAVIDSEGHVVTYGEMVRCALDLRRQHADHRSLCFMYIQNTAACAMQLIAALASERLVPLCLNTRLDEDVLKNLMDCYRPELTYSDKEGWKRTGFEPVEMHPELSHLLPTSGSTGSPKLVRHKYSNIEASALNISTFFELKPEDRPLLVLPLYYTMGLSVLFSHLKVGATVLLTGQSMTDAGFWKFLKEEHATSFTGVPYSYDILNKMRFFRANLPDMELLTQGGGRMPKELNLAFATFCRDTGRRWIATYGQSECTARMAYLPPQWAVEKVGSIGVAVPNGELWLQDEDGRIVEGHDLEGELCYRGGNVTMGYAVCVDDLARGDERHGQICTGDLARRDKDGCYYIVGRKSRFIKLFGIRVGLDECEQIIESALSTECACVGTDQKMTVYITDATKCAQAKKLLVERTHIVASAFEVIAIDSIPKNDTGKKLYKSLKP